MSDIHVPPVALGFVHRRIYGPDRDIGLFQWAPSTFRSVEKADEATELMRGITGMGFHEALEVFEKLASNTPGPRKSGSIIINGREVDVTYHAQPWAVIHNKKRGSR